MSFSKEGDKGFPLEKLLFHTYCAKCIYKEISSSVEIGLLRLQLYTYIPYVFVFRPHCAHQGLLPSKHALDCAIILWWILLSLLTSIFSESRETWTPLMELMLQSEPKWNLCLAEWCSHPREKNVSPPALWSASIKCFYTNRIFPGKKDKAQNASLTLPLY